MRPRIPRGFSIRNAALDDIPAAAAVGRACERADVDDLDLNEEWLRDDWTRPRFDTATDAWVVETPGGEIVAFAYT